ncbi:MAG: imidazolonepropionase [Oscillospiraceae bacterium]|nr:imidazolonepropionase [Oscillospiraceae bacterium]
MPRKYQKAQELLTVINARLAEGKTQREIAEKSGLKDKYVVKRLLSRERRKEEKRAAWIVLRPKGRTRKDAEPRDIVKEHAYEIRRLKMENDLSRDFLSLTGKE